MLLLIAVPNLAGCRQRRPPEPPLATGFLEALPGFRTPGFDAQGFRKQVASGPRDLAHELAAARRAGIPLAAPELAAPPIPEAENAAPCYRRLTRLLKKTPLDPPARSSMSALCALSQARAADVAAARTLMAQRPELLAVIHQAADRPRCDFRRDWSVGPELPLLEYAPMREAARLLAAESYLLALDGRYPEAIRNQRRGFRIARHAAADPNVIGYLVGVAIQGITLSGMRQILCLAGPQSQVAGTVRQAVLGHRAAFDFRRALKTEVVFGRTMLARLRTGGPPALSELAAPAAEAAPGAGSPSRSPWQGRSPQDRAAWQQFVDAAEADYLRRMRELIAARSRTSLSEFRADAERNAQEVKAGDVDPVVRFSAIMIPTFRRAREQGDVARASEAVTIAGASLLTYLARHGAFPARLDAVRPPPPGDPFTGQALQYSRTPAGFVVFSAGPEGLAEPPSVATRSKRRQAFFQYPLPPPRPAAATGPARQPPP